jgi:hypothetical protein
MVAVAVLPETDVEVVDAPPVPCDPAASESEPASLGGRIQFCFSSHVGSALHAAPYIGKKARSPMMPIRVVTSRSISRVGRMRQSIA